MGFYVKTGTSTWKVAKNLFVKTNSSTWSPIKKMFVKTASNLWQQFWPKSGPYTTTSPYFSTDAAGNNQPSGYTLSDNSTIYLQAGTWVSNGSSISSYSYKIYTSTSVSGGNLTQVASGSITNHVAVTLTDSTYDGLYIIGEVTANRLDGVSGSDSTDTYGYRYFVMRKYAPRLDTGSNPPSISSNSSSTQTTTSGGILVARGAPYSLLLTADWDKSSDYLPDITKSQVAWYSSPNYYSTADQVISNATSITNGVVTSSPTTTGSTYHVTSTLTVSSLSSSLYFYAVTVEQNSNTIYNLSTGTKKYAYVSVNPSPTPTAYPTLTATTPAGFYGKPNSFTVGATVTGNAGHWSPTPNGTYPIQSLFLYSTGGDISIPNQSTSYWKTVYSASGTWFYVDQTQDQNHSFTLDASFYDSSGTGTIATTSAGKYLEYYVLAGNGDSITSSSDFYTNSQKIYPQPVATYITSISATTSNTISFSYGGLYYPYSIQLQYSTDNSTWTTLSPVYTLSGYTGTFTNVSVPSTTSLYYYRLICSNADGVYLYSTSKALIPSFTINNVTDSSLAPTTPSAPTLVAGTGAGINSILFDWASSIPSDTASYGVTVWGPGMGSGTWTQASPFTTTGRTSINLYDSTTNATGIYDYYLPISTSANNSSVSAYVTATGNIKRVNVTWNASTGINSYKILYTLSGTVNGTYDGTYTSASQTSTSFTLDLSQTGGTFQLTGIYGYTSTDGTGDYGTGILPSTTTITPVVKTSQGSTASANFTYTDPSYTYTASNHLYFATDGFIDFSAAAVGAVLPTTGKIMPFYLADFMQESLKYATITNGTNNFLILYWTGRRFSGGVTGELQFEIWFTEGQQYAYIDYTAFPSGVSVLPIRYVSNGVSQNTAVSGINSSNRQVKFYFNTNSNAVFANGTLFTPKTSSWGGWLTASAPTGGADVGYTDLSIPTGSGPNAPTSLSASSTSSSITVSFTAPTSNGGSNISDYQYSTDNSTWTAAGSTSTSITVSSLSANTSYTVYIRALNYGGYTGTTASITKSTSALQTALTPTFATYAEANVISGGFTGTVTNYDSNFTWTLSASAGTVTKGTASGTNLPFTVTGLTPNQASTITVITTRTGYNSGSATTQFTAYPKITKIVSTGGGSTAPFMSWNVTMINSGGAYYFYTLRGTTTPPATSTTAAYNTVNPITSGSGGLNYYYQLVITPYSGTSAASTGTAGYGPKTTTILRNTSVGVTVTDNY